MEELCLEKPWTSMGLWSGYSRLAVEWLAVPRHGKGRAHSMPCSWRCLQYTALASYLLDYPTVCVTSMQRKCRGGARLVSSLLAPTPFDHSR